MTTDALFPPIAAIPIADTIRHGLTSEPSPCWELVDSDGRPDDDAGHYQTETAAADAGPVEPTDPGEEWDGPRTPRLRPTPCWTATAACGDRYDQDEGVVHFATRDEAAAVVLEGDWRVRDGALLCSDPDCCEETA